MSRQRMTHAEFMAEAVRRFGSNVDNWKFVCPACGTVQSVGQLHAVLLERSPAAADDVQAYAAYACIGRFTGQGDAGIAAKRRGEPWDKGCNWTLGGLLQIHELEVIMPDDRARPTFQLAPADAPAAANTENSA